MATKPAVLIVPGSFTTPDLYDSLVDGLSIQGYEAYVYGLPSASRKPPEEAATLADDADFFHEKLTQLTDAGKDVVVLGHSYGGAVVTETVNGLTEKRDGKGRVIGLIYLSALVPLEGHSLASMTAHLGFDFIKADGPFLYHDPVENSARINLSDIPLEKGIEIVKAMPYHSALSFGSELQKAGYKDVDQIAYITCLQDKCFPREFLNQMAENAKSGGRPVKEYSIDSGHCPNISQPENLVKLVAEILETQFV